MRFSTFDLWMFVILTAITDIITTCIGIYVLSFSETNPFIFTTSGYTFFMLMVLLKTGAILFSYSLSISFDYRRIVPLVLGSVWFIVSAWNIALIFIKVL